MSRSIGTCVYLLVLAVLCAACARRNAPVLPPTPEETVLVSDNALDTLKLCRFSDEEGPVYFAHRLHADLRALDDGNHITCKRCHHDLTTHSSSIPRSCASCHVQHDGPNPTGIITI